MMKRTLLKKVRGAMGAAILGGGMMFAGAADAAPIANGMKIGIDLGPTLTTNWNNFPTNNSSVAAGSVVDLTGTVVDNVSIATSNAQFTNNDGSNNFVGLSTNGGALPPEFVDSVTTDIAGNFNLGDGTPYTVTINGLNPSLLYNIVAVTSANYTPIDTITITGAVVSAPSAISRPAAQSQGLFHTFNLVAPDANGTLVMSVVDTDTSANPILNGALITVVPEPASLALGLGGLALTAVAARRRK